MNIIFATQILDSKQEQCTYHQDSWSLLMTFKHQIFTP